MQTTMPTPTFCGQLSIASGHIPPPITVIKPHDIVVVNCPQLLNRKDSRTVQEITSTRFPGHKVVVLSGGASISFIRSATEQPTLSDN